MSQLNRAKPRAIRIAVRCDTVVVLTVGHGTTVLQYNETWIVDGTSAIVRIPAHLHGLKDGAAELSVSGMKFLLPEWRGKLRSADTGKDVHASSTGHVDAQEVFMSGIGCYRCKLADPKPFPHFYVNYPDFYLKLDGYRTPFKGEKWKLFNCKGEKMGDEWYVVKSLENSTPLDHNLQGFALKIRYEDFQQLKDHGRELQATGRVTPPPDLPLLRPSPPATPGRGSPVLSIESGSTESSADLSQHLNLASGLTFSMSRESAASIGSGSSSGDLTPTANVLPLRRVLSHSGSSQMSHISGSPSALSPQERIELEVGAFVQQLDGEFGLRERSGTWWRALFARLGEYPLAAKALQETAAQGVF